MKRTCVVFAATLIILSGCGRNSEPEGTLFVSGRIDGDSVDISSKIAGRVVDLKVREGDSVQPNQVLALLSSEQAEAIRDAQKSRIVSDLRRLDQLQKQALTYNGKVDQAKLYEAQAETDAPNRVKQAEATLAAAQADLVRTEAELKQAQVDAKRYAPLIKTGAVAAQMGEQYATREDIAHASADASRKEVAAAEASLEQSRAQMQNIPIKAADRTTLLAQVDELQQQIAGAKADVAADRAGLRKVEADFNDLTIRAPIAGTILTRSAEPGKVIQPGQTIFTMVDMKSLYLRGFVPEASIGKVKVGQQAKVYLDSDPKQAIAAEVIRIDPQAMFTPENTYFKEDRVKQVLGLKLGLRGAFGFAKPGMPADGRIQISGQPQTAAQLQTGQP
jgi:HlyD family secretion protein